jgi:hypothetical protein
LLVFPSFPEPSSILFSAGPMYVYSIAALCTPSTDIRFTCPFYLWRHSPVSWIL